ncbi:MAG: butyrate kinase [Candidatus Delongbacteria bacterium]|jgi:butyrate kinase|nr:butyrate kinase [Candidatus Delongbacteria bacterium]
MDEQRILAINPGSTSTKIAVYAASKLLFLKNIKHSVEDLAGFEVITDQFDFRKAVILKELKEAEIDLNKLKIIVGRGGILKPVPSGVFRINDKMKHDLIHSEKKHASNLGGLIADDIAQSLPGAQAFIADPVVVDEMHDLARITGHPLFERASIFHALNQKAVARKYAKSNDVKYEELNLIVVHLGGGISIGGHRNGKVIDVNQAIDGEGPFSPERAGTLPVGDVIAMAFSGKYTHDEMKKMVTGQGGFAAYLGTNDAYEVEQRVEKGDQKANLIHCAMTYQIGKSIGAMSTVFMGKVDQIIITGGIAYNKPFIAKLKEICDWIAPFTVYPGEDEMEALAMNGLMVLNKEIEPIEYK